MKHHVLPLMGITLSLTAIAGSVMAIPNLLPEPAPNKLNNIDISSLWTSRPVSVDRRRQAFERLPALIVPQQELSDRKSGVTVIEASAPPLEASATPPETPTEQANGLDNDAVDAGGANQSDRPDTAATEWCSEQYRSYRVSDNTYQAYSGSRRQCDPPFVATLRHWGKANNSQHAASVESDHGADNHVQWCFARYRSYNPDDNTYRAFSGEMRACASPYI